MPSILSKTAALSLAFLLINGATAHPHLRRDDASMSAAFSSMFAAGAYTANEHMDGSTNNNVVIEKFLWSLNNLRYQHDAPPVYWNVTLWEYATAWATKCPNSHSFGPYGETMGSGSQDASYDMNSFGEEANWNGEVVTDSDTYMKSGHFFTEMWKATQYIGCARVWCDTANTGKQINNWISVCSYQYSAGVEGFAGNISARSNEGPPKEWDPPENHVSFTSFPPIVSPAQTWPAMISGTSIPNLGPTLVDLPPNVVATASGVSVTATTNSDTNPVKGPTKVPGTGALGSGSVLPTNGPTAGSAVSPSGPSPTAAPSSTRTSSKPKPTSESVSAQDVSDSMVTSAPSVSASTFAHQGNTEQPAQLPAGPVSDSSSDGGVVEVTQVVTARVTDIVTVTQ